MLCFIMKEFNVTGICVPKKHYMVDITERLKKMKELVEAGKYFTINRGRQYGKTTTLKEFSKYIKKDYDVCDLDFQAMSFDSFKNEAVFTQSLAKIILNGVKYRKLSIPLEAMESFRGIAEKDTEKVQMDDLFSVFLDWCIQSERPVVFMIDEVDSALNSQVFLDFLAGLRLQYLERENDEDYKTFQSVILAGVTDIKNLKRKFRPDEAHKVNSPWNIAVDFALDMSLSAEGIAGMLAEYENDHHTGMNVAEISQEIHDYTSGYPFLVSRLCQIMDKELCVDQKENFKTLSDAWTIWGISESVKRIVFENNTLFDSLMGKVQSSEALSDVLEYILFSGEPVLFNPDNLSYADARMYGFVCRKGDALAVSNRIFEMRLYNYFLNQDEIKSVPIYKAASYDRDFFVHAGGLYMERILERYIVSFHDIYGENAENFDEEEGRRRFLLYLQPIINGTGNYYIEAQTRNNRRMDVVVDYLGKRYVIELKIWRGDAYHERGEKQLMDYLSYYHMNTGYMISYNFNKKKEPGIHHIQVGDKVLVEAVL